MAVGIMFDGVGVTHDQYDQVFKRVSPNRELPAGMLSHHAGPTEGGFCVIETWESLEDLQRFFAGQGGEALAAAGIQAQPKVFEIVNSL